MDWREYVNSPLWSILVETTHAMVMYPHHKAYTRDVVFHEHPDIDPTALAVKIGIPLGEALVIFFELEKAKSESQTR